MLTTLIKRAGAALCLWLATCSLPAQVPQLLNYQGRVAVGTTTFNGAGQFKFALVNSDGSTTYWSNDATSAAGGEPTTPVAIPVANGLYSVILGDSTLPNMTGIPYTVFANPDVRLRIWFNDGTNGSQLLSPDQRIVAVGYAMQAATVRDGAITSAKIAPGAVGTAQLAADAGNSTNAPGTIVQRDANGSFSAGTITATEFTGSGTGLTNIPGTFSWRVVTGTTQQATTNTGYLLMNNALTTVTLPPAPAVGEVVRVRGVGAGGWKLMFNEGQTLGEPLNATSLAPNDQSWQSVASSADGTKLVAVVYGGQIYTSTNSGLSWIPRENNRVWQTVASSADGTKLIAAVFNGQIYTSADSGLSWTARENNRSWQSVASSTDGTKLVAVVHNRQIYTSADSGFSWIPRDSNRPWRSVASSADGTKLVAVVYGGQIYTSADSGLSWNPQNNSLPWQAVASSADGANLVAIVYGGQIYTSSDSGLTWIPRDNHRPWQGVASSADGTKLVTVVDGGQIYASADGITFTPPPTGVVTFLSGNQHTEVELVYSGDGLFVPVGDLGMRP